MMSRTILLTLSYALRTKNVEVITQAVLGRRGGLKRVIPLTS